MYILNIARTMKKKSVNEIRGTLKTIIIGFPKESSYDSTKRLKKKVYCCLKTN